MSVEDDFEQPTTENRKLNRDEVGLMASALVKKHEIIKGRNGQSYKIVEKLGRGSFGSVFLIESLQESKFQAALKLVQSQSIIETEYAVLKKAFENNSDRLCKLLDSGITEDGMEFIVMDLLGPDLSQFIKSESSLKIKLKVSEQCLTAIEALHKLGYLHRDIKPNNFVLGRKGSDKEYVVILIDFGMAETIKSEMKNCTGTELYGSIAGWEERNQGPKDDLESWFYVLMEWFSELPWSVEEHEEEHLELKKAIRDDNTEVFKQFFGDLDFQSLKKTDYLMDFAKIMRYIDSLKFDEVPDYNRIHYFLQCAYWEVCTTSTAEHKEKISNLRSSRQEKEEYLAEHAEKEKEVASFKRYTCGPVEQPANLTFFSSIVYDENGKYVKNVEYCGISLNQYKIYAQRAKKNAATKHLVFACIRCINSKPCGLEIFVEYDGTETTWQEAKVLRVKGDPNDCRKLNKIKEDYKLFLEKDQPGK